MRISQEWNSKQGCILCEDVMRDREGLTMDKRTKAKTRSHPPSPHFFVPFICFSARLFVTLTYALLRSKFLDKPSETSFVILSLGKSKLKTSFYLLFRSLIRNSDLRFAPVEVTFAQQFQIKNKFLFGIVFAYS